MRRLLQVSGLLAIVAGGASCGDVIRQSRSPVVLVMNSLQGAPGNKPTTLVSPLSSDVITNVTTPPPCSTATPCATVFNDVGQASIGGAMKDASVTPTSNNQVTITRYHVEFVRADGRNTPGVDVPYPFDGAATGTVPAGGSVTVGFELVRSIAKEEAPLAQLASSSGSISTIARVTFYGRDLVGNDVSVTGSISVNFGNFADQ